ncbi:MAG: hypothetical protein WBP59_14940 [Ilumatobacteraceae bacterium]
MEILRVRRPFWMHQIVEYLVGIGLVSASIQQLEPAVPAVLGLVIILNAAVAKGAAGAFRLVGKRLHQQLDLVVIGLLVAGAVQPWITVENVSRLMLGAVAFVMFFVWFHTDFSERMSRKERKAASKGAGGTTQRPTSEDIGRGAGRLVGGGVNSLKRWKDSIGGDSQVADD